MASAPFIKCEATKYTEVGIVGQSAEESVKDLVDNSIKMEREKGGGAQGRDRHKVEHHILRFTTRVTFSKNTTRITN